MSAEYDNKRVTGMYTSNVQSVTSKPLSGRMGEERKLSAKLRSYDNIVHELRM